MRENPPAFPVELGWGLEPGEAHQTGQHTAQFPGMTLRDYFAGQALAGLLANPGGPVQANNACGWTFANCGIHDVAQEAYGLADAMLAQRSKP